MSTKSKLLTLLEQNRGQVVSGQKAAIRLGVSRTSVWKNVEALRREGYPIEAASGGGYRLPEQSDLLSEEALRVWLENPDTPVVVLEETSSTNMEAKKLAMEGAPAGTLVMARRQKSGRGRMGRTFESPPGGLYMSVVLRPQCGMEDTALITSIAAVAACRAVEQLCGLSLSIKWVNDLYYQNKKCCGILCEGETGLETGRMEYVVSGIGINYTTPNEAWPPELTPIATALFPGGNPPVPKAQLAAAIHKNLLAMASALPQREFLEEYRRRNLVLERNITVAADPPYPAKAVAIDDGAGLVVRLEDGSQKTLRSGEISVKLQS